jgi:hypothetical protein
MRTASKWAVVFLAAASVGVFAIPTSRGDDTATTQPSADTQSAVGSITGVVMKDGKPLANARVGLIDVAQVKKAGKRKKGADATAAPEKRQRPTPTATAMTDSEGKFTLNDVKVGDYMVMAMAKGEGRGRARASIAAGQTANVEVQITQPAGGGKNGGGKHGGGKAGKASTGQQT